MVELIVYNKAEKTLMKSLIKEFWLAHNHYNQSDEETEDDLADWTKEGQVLYFIRYDNINVGFLRLGSRGAAADWLEDIFVLSEYQNRGIGSAVIVLAEKIVRKYSDSMYIESAARNERAIRLYRKLGYDCLNTITIRKDFNPEDFTCISEVKVFENEFEIRKVKE